MNKMKSLPSNESNSLVALNHSNDIVSYLSKKRRTRWDDNNKPCTILYNLTKFN